MNKKWQYKTFDSRIPFNEDELNNLGSDGWELISTYYVPRTLTLDERTIYYFKKQL